MDNPNYRRMLERFIRESNLIEGIDRKETDEEVLEADRFLHLDLVTVRELEKFVSVYQPGARLRRYRGMDVRVGSYIAPLGGVDILLRLNDLLKDVNAGLDPWTAHCRYETLHPFTDGNGRSGRMLWAWQMTPFKMQLGFLHAFYYQTLKNSPGRR